MTRIDRRTVSSWSTRIFGFLSTAWVLYTLYAILRFGGAVVVDPGTTSRIMAVRNGDALFSAVGLTFHGLTGAALVVFEIVVVGAALLAGLFASGRRRQTGPLVLVAWSSLWLANALWLRSHGWQHGLDTVGIAVAWVATVGWTVSVAIHARS